MKQIIFKDITIKNFLSVGNPLTLSFNSGINLITGKNLDKDGDGNGIGKSAILNALYFALYGNTINDLKKEHIINKIFKKNCEVTLNLDVNKDGQITTYKIHRGLGPSFCHIYSNEVKNDTLSTIPATNEFIQNLISTSSLVFLNTVIMTPNNSIPFMAQKAIEKRNFIEGIFKLEVFKHMLSTARETYHNYLKDHNMYDMQYNETLNNIKNYQQKKNEFEDNRKISLIQLEARKQDNIEKLSNIENTIIPFNQEEYTKLSTELKDKNSELLKIETILEKFNKVISDANAKITLSNQQETNYTRLLKNYPDTLVLMDIPNVDINPINDNIKKCREEISTSNANIKINESLIAKLKKYGNICTACERPFSNDEQKDTTDKINTSTKIIEESKINILNNQNNIKKYEDDILTIKKDIEDVKANNTKYNEKLKYTTELSQLTSSKGEQSDIFNKYTEDIKTVKESKIKIQSIVESIKASIVEFDNIKIKNRYIQETINTHKTYITNTENDIIKLKNSVNQFDDMIVKETDKSKKVEIELNVVKEKMSIYEVIKYIISEEGVKSYIIKKLLKTLNERIAYYMEKLNANGNLIFNEYFEDTIVDERGRETTYNNYSNGEKKRVDLACLFAFMDIRMLQGDVSFNIAFYDELLDSAISVQCSKSIFTIFKERFEQLNESSYIVSHRLENIKNPMINNIVFLEKFNEMTRLGKYEN